MLRTTFSRGGRLQSYLTADGRRGYPAADGQRGRRYGLASIKKASVEDYWRTQIRSGEGKPRKKLQHDYHTHALSSSIEYIVFFFCRIRCTICGVQQWRIAIPYQGELLYRLTCQLFYQVSFQVRYQSFTCS
jgi:hypothetical protein